VSFSFFKYSNSEVGGLPHPDLKLNHTSQQMSTAFSCMLIGQANAQEGFIEIMTRMRKLDVRPVYLH
jgi:hypothetical protein